MLKAWAWSRWCGCILSASLAAYSQVFKSRWLCFSLDPTPSPISVQQISSRRALVAKAVSLCFPDLHVAFSHILLQHTQHIHPHRFTYAHACRHIHTGIKELKGKVDLSPPRQNPLMSVLFSNVQSHYSIFKDYGQPLFTIILSSSGSHSWPSGHAAPVSTSVPGWANSNLWALPLFSLPRLTPIYHTVFR